MQDMYYYFSLDPTVYTDTTGYGRFLNHSCQHPNIKAQVLSYQDGNALYPRVVFVARHFIPKGSELRWNYGPQDPEVMAQKGMEWMAE